MTRAMRTWDAYWYGPVSAVRPYLWIKGLLLLLALDIWVLRLGRAGLYGAHGFNVAHFAWLDTVQPLPTPALYAGVLVLCGLLSLVLALTPMNRPALTALFVLYTYSWAMSMRDLFQHHYLISLFLLCAVFFPRIGVADLRSSTAPRTSAFGYMLLRTAAAVVFVFAAIAKLDAEWRAGATLRSIGRAETVLEPAAGSLATLGVSDATFWALIAHATIGIELAIALTYLAAFQRDAATGHLARLAFVVAGVLAVSLHLGFETLGLHIGWFSAYMIMLAGVVFFPERWLLDVATVADWPARRLAAAARRWGDQSSRAAAGAPTIPLAAVVGVGMVLIGAMLDVPGAFEACAIAALALLATTLVAALRGSAASARRGVAATALAACAMWVTVANSSVRYQLHSQRFDYLQMAGDGEGARTAYARTERHAPRGDAHVQARLAHMLGLLGRPAEEIVHYHRALELDPELLAAHNNLAWLRATHPDPAIRDASEAIRLGERAAALTGGRDAPILDTLAAAYAAGGRYEQAAATARVAIQAASEIGAAELAREIGKRLARYERGMSWVSHQSDATGE